MLLYHNELKTYLLTKIIPSILLIYRGFFFSGSFHRMIPYVTDIDLLTIDETKTLPYLYYQRILQIMETLSKSSTVHFIYLNCGFDERFRVTPEDYKEKLQSIKGDILPEMEDAVEEILQRDIVISEKCFLLNNLLKPFYKVKWSEEEIRMGQKTSPPLNFFDTLASNNSLIFRYYTMIGSFPLGIDYTYYYRDYNPLSQKAEFEDLLLGDVYHGNYYSLFLGLMKYFRRHKKTKYYNEIHQITEVQYGPLKQIMQIVEMFKLLYLYDLLDTGLVDTILEELLLDLQENEVVDYYRTPHLKALQKFHPVSDLKLTGQIYKLLLKISQEIEEYLSESVKRHFFQYLASVPERDKNDLYRELHFT